MFKEYYNKMHPHLGERWGLVGEEMTDVFIRFFDTMAKYVDDKLNEKKETE